jgi:hypothetical protein
MLWLYDEILYNIYTINLYWVLIFCDIYQWDK